MTVRHRILHANGPSRALGGPGRTQLPADVVGQRRGRVRDAVRARLLPSRRAQGTRAQLGALPSVLRVGAEARGAGAEVLPQRVRLLPHHAREPEGKGERKSLMQI